MIITCEQCQARFKLADEKLKTEGTKVRCSKCQNIFTVFPPPPPEQPADGGDSALPPVDTRGSSPPPDLTAPESSPEGSSSEAEPGGGLEFEFEVQAPTPFGEFDFESAFAEEPGATPAEAGIESTITPPEEFNFAGEPPTDAGPGEFALDDEPVTVTAPDAFTFDEEPAADTSSGFDFSAEPVPAAEPGEAASATSFGEISFGDEGDDGFSFDNQATAETSAFGEEEHPWGEPGGVKEDDFNFNAPKFDSPAGAVAPKSPESGLSFGEIDFSDGDETGETLPSFDNELNSAQQPPPPPEIAEPPAPPPPPALTVQRQPVSRPRSEELGPPPAPRRGPISKIMVGLGLLLLVLCSAGVYLFISGEGERLIGQLIMKIKGEDPTGPVEQRIGLNISGSSYVDNREAGQLLVVQGTAVNNFAAPRSAISVKGLILDAAGKTIQQQTVFCGNYLSEERLKTLKYAEIEEAMSNQFGDSLSNMNIKPGTVLRFTIVFRNVPKEMANISVEVVDSKPGGS